MKKREKKGERLSVKPEKGCKYRRKERERKKEKRKKERVGGIQWERQAERSGK